MVMSKNRGEYKRRWIRHFKSFVSVSRPYQECTLSCYRIFKSSIAHIYFVIYRQWLYYCWKDYFLIVVRPRTVVNIWSPPPPPPQKKVAQNIPFHKLGLGQSSTLTKNAWKSGSDGLFPHYFWWQNIYQCGKYHTGKSVQYFFTAE